MDSLDDLLKAELRSAGADLVGFGDLSELPGAVRYGLPMGVSVAVKYPKEVIRGISKMPTKEYREQYDFLNEKLDKLVTLGADYLQGLGYRAVAKTLSVVGQTSTDYASELPHKTVATRADIGWIGKCALLVTEQYGSMIRLSSLLTDAPLTAASPVNTSKCGGCMVCAEACPGKAVSGKNWDVSMEREAFFDAVRCRTAARERSMQAIGEQLTICGKCVVSCPYTQRYLKSND